MREFINLIESMSYDIVTKPQLITMYHGGRNLESDYNEIIGNKSGQIVHGVGLYLISDISIAAKYAKGGNKLYRVTFEKGNDANDVILTNKACVDWAKKYLPKNKSISIDFWNWFEKTSERMNNSGGIRAEQFSNLVLNYNLIKPSKSAEFRKWLIDQGVDYSVSYNYGGSKNVMVVLVNPKKIKKVEVIKWNDIPPEQYKLDINLNEDVQDVIPVLYHGTSKESAENLIKNGWEPNKWSQGSQQGQRRYLYVTNGYENAEWYADEKQNGVVIKLTNVPKSYLKVDPEDGIGQTVDDEINTKIGFPSNLVLTTPLPASFFSYVSNV